MHVAHIELQNRTCSPLLSAADPSNRSNAMAIDWAWLDERRTKRTENGHKRYNGVRRRNACGNTRDFMRGDVIYMSGHHDNVPWIGQIVDFYDTQQPIRPKTFSVRWLYHRNQVEQQYVLEEWERKGNTVYPDELFLSDHVEHELNPVELIIEKVHVTQYKPEIPKLRRKWLHTNDIVRLVRYFICHSEIGFNDSCPVRKLKRNELSGVLKRRSTRSEYFRPHIIKEAKCFIDDEAIQSTSIFIEHDDNQILPQSKPKFKESEKQTMSQKQAPPHPLTKKQRQEKKRRKRWERMQRNEKLAKHGSKRARQHRNRSEKRHAANSKKPGVQELQEFINSEYS